MDPVRTLDFIGFCDWLEKYHPEITRLEDVDCSARKQLLREFEYAGFALQLTNRWSISPEELDILRVRVNFRTHLLGDFLERYRSRPNHALFLHTTEDQILERHIHGHWMSLNGLSGEVCDIYISMLQLKGEEDAFTQMQSIRSLPGFTKPTPKDLPLLHVWSRDAGTTISLADCRDGDDLTRALRRVFSFLHELDDPLDQTSASELYRLTRQMQAVTNEDDMRLGDAERKAARRSHIGQFGPESANQSLFPEPSIFISYRRQDSQDVVGRIYDSLISEFGRQRIVRDLDHLELGKPFPEALEAAIANAGISLVIIGPNWIDATDEEGNRRLDASTDFVRLEVERCLEAGIPVVPVLVTHARMPRATELPESIRQLVHRHGMPVRPDPDFHSDMDRLIRRLRSLVS